MQAFTLQFNIMVQARHILGLYNSLADALFHQQIERFRELNPGASTHPETLPPIGGMMLKE